MGSYLGCRARNARWPDYASLAPRRAYMEVIEMIAWKGVAFLVGLAVSLSLAVVSTGSAAPAPLVIAVEGPQSGEQAPNGLDQLRGVRLAVRRLDAHGGLWDGRKVVVYAADDKADATNATAVARPVIARRIHFLIRPYK